jgi:hypothetical protein
MAEKSPALEDLEVEIISSNDGTAKRSAVADIASAIETILSEEHIDQKTNLTSENEDGLICIDVLQAHFLRAFKYEFPSLVALKKSKQEHVLSVGGYRSTQIVDILKSLQTTIVSSDNPLSSRLLGRGR